MLLSVEIPDSFAHQLRLDGPEQGRRALEMFSLEGYRAGELTAAQVGEMLGMTFDETEAFLHEHGAHLQYTFEDFKNDSDNLSLFLAK